ncbi:unnamed protein product [Wuchereria bancrofti]|uniref:Uncharacterized protein n=1 Tax=Wuchereria bancrofti TaxID=6293 RepID=A0A3P7DZK3_WUCBA|nr:unnamed protein product [Wuchereria bancrofti]
MPSQSLSNYDHYTGKDTRVKADQLLNISHLMTTITMMMVMKTTPTMTVCTRGKEAEREEYYKQSPIAA